MFLVHCQIHGAKDQPSYSTVPLSWVQWQSRLGSCYLKECPSRHQDKGCTSHLTSNDQSSSWWPSPTTLAPDPVFNIRHKLEAAVADRSRDALCSRPPKSYQVVHETQLLQTKCAMLCVTISGCIGLVNCVRWVYGINYQCTSEASIVTSAIIS